MSAERLRASARILATVARTGLGVLLSSALAAFVAALLVPAALGYDRYVITGGSMEPNIPLGSLAYAKVVPTGSLRVGDVITYVPPDKPRPVTHRIIAEPRDATVDGKGTRRVFQTKGDANAAPDLSLFALARPTQARYRFHLPYAGFVLIGLSRPDVRTYLIGVPALLVALVIVVGLWRESGKLAHDADDTATVAAS